MKPLNLDNKPCSPISSNCVVWQGPDIPCIHLCTGDSVSDVVHKLATELCEVLETLKVSNYDLTCFTAISCGPQNFQELVQFILDQLCLLEGGTPASSGGTVVPITRPITRPISDTKLPGKGELAATPVFTKARASETCPDCVVTVPDEFVVGTQRTMQLVDYAVIMGERIAGIVTEVSLINDQMADVITRVVRLENTPAPSLAMPSFTIGCQIGTLLSGTTQDIDVLLEEFINNVWCGFYAVTGSVTDLTNAVGTQEPCITETSSTISNPGTTYGIGYPAWEADPTTIADSITNIWLVLCDLYTFLSSPQVITVTDTNTVDLELSADNELTAKVQDTGWVNLEGFDWYSGTADADGVRPQCRRVGNVIHFRGIAYVPLIQTGKTIVEPLTSPDHYNNLTDVAPATSGDGSVFTDPAGSVKWNQNQSVIPPTVVSALENLDGTYRLPYPTMMSRVIEVGANGTMLNSVGRLGILSTGVLYFATLKDQELPAGVGTLLAGASPLRYVNTNIRVGEFIPNFANADTDIHNLPAAGASNLVAESGFPDAAGTDVTWPISCDAAEEDQIGGFYATLEGLTAFVSCDSTTAVASCYTP